MTTEKIPEKMYTELKTLICPKCGLSLVWDDPGVWYCEGPKCDYSENNNITICESDWCDSHILSKDINFDNIEDRYCNIKDEHGLTCILVAHSEQSHFEAEQAKIDEHMKHCNDLDCECRNM